VIASGVESMTRCPMGMSVVLPMKAGMGVPKSPRQEERYPNIQFSQFAGAEMVAKKYGLTKDQLDEYGYRSHQNATAATSKSLKGFEFNWQQKPDYYKLTK
jgi:acetyl-CoA C-acetyltransferase